MLLAADGNHNGVVDGAGYVLWRNNLGASLAAGAETSPATLSVVAPAVSISEQSSTTIESVATESFVDVATDRGNSTTLRATAFAAMSSLRAESATIIVARANPRQELARWQLGDKSPHITDQSHDAALMAVLAEDPAVRPHSVGITKHVADSEGQSCLTKSDDGDVGTATGRKLNPALRQTAWSVAASICRA